MCPVSIPILKLGVFLGYVHRRGGSLLQRYHDTRDGLLETFACLVLGGHGRCLGSMRLALLFGHYLEQLGVLKSLVSDYRPYFFHFS